MPCPSHVECPFCAEIPTSFVGACACCADTTPVTTPDAHVPDRVAFTPDHIDPTRPAPFAKRAVEGITVSEAAIVLSGPPPKPKKDHIGTLKRFLTR